MSTVTAERNARTHDAEQSATTQELRDEVLRVLWRKRRACAADLANELRQPATAGEVIGIVESLERDGLIHRASDPSGRQYSHPHQTVYEVAR